MDSNVKYNVVVKNDNSVRVQSVGTVKVQNQGNTRLLVDGHVCLDPLETYELAMTEGGCLNHSFQFDFFTLANPPSVDNYRIYAGNRALVITIERAKNL